MSTQAKDTTIEISGETWDLSEYDFPARRDSPDPRNLIETIIDCGGVLRHAAAELECSARTIYNWVHKFPPVEAAVDDTRASVAYKARERLIELMEQDDDRRTAYKSAVKLLCQFHPVLDWTRSQRIIRENAKDESEEVDEEEIENMDQDELLDRLSELTNGDGTA